MTPSPELSRLIAAVEINNVALCEATVSRSIRQADGAKVEVQLNRDAKLAEIAGHQFFVRAELDLHVVPQGAEQPAVSITAAFELTYILPVDFEVTEDVLNEFARVNGVFNVWPYWREFLQNTMARMNLPPITIPVFRLKPVAEIESEE